MLLLFHLMRSSKSNYSVLQDPCDGLLSILSGNSCKIVFYPLFSFLFLKDERGPI